MTTDFTDNDGGRATPYGISLLIVDDDPTILATEAEFFKLHDLITKTALTAEEAIEACNREVFDVIITDLKMPEMSGLDLLKRLKAKDSNTEIIIVTGFGSVETAIDAMKHGAFSYMLKPTNLDRLLAEIRNAAQTRHLKLENFVLKHSNAQKEPSFEAFKSEKMVKVMALLKTAAKSESAILLSGENGSGKEIAANYIHSSSKRKNEAFIKAHCTSFSENMLESELFGHEKDASAGISSSKIGKFELADRGTLFLDEIDKIPTDIQNKILRILNEQTIERVGGSSKLPASFRLITATNGSLSTLLKNEIFRKDFYYKISVVPIEIPPLRDMIEDIPNLSKFLIEKACKQLGTSKKDLSDSALLVLSAYSWPGNIRELQNVIERALVLDKDGVIDSDDLPIELTSKGSSQSDLSDLNNLKRAAKAFEKGFISRALSSNSNNITKTALAIGISRRSLQQKIIKHALR